MIIEKVILDYLKDANIAGIGDRVFLEAPKDNGAYVLIQKTGGSASNKINSATVAIQSVTLTSLYDAAVINEKIKKLLDEIVFDTPIYQTTLNNDLNFSNTATKQYRYQALYNIRF